MKEWLLSVSAVILTTVLLELVISEGKIKKYIQGILRLALVVAMIFPLLKFVKSDFNPNLDIDSDFSDGIIDFDFLDRIHAARYAETERLLKNDLKLLGISDADVSIAICYGASGAVEPDYVTVDLTGAVITSEEENIILIDKIKSTVAKRLEIAEERIIIYGVA